MSAAKLIVPSLDFLQGKERTRLRELSANYDCSDNGNVLDIEIELPGVQKDDVAVRIDGDALVVRGKRFMRTGERVTKIAVESHKESDNGNSKTCNGKDEGTKPDAVISKKIREKEEKIKGDKSTKDAQDEEISTDAAVEVKAIKTENAVTEIRRAIVYVFESRLGYNMDADGIKAVGYSDGVLKLQVPMKSKKPFRTIEV